MIETAAQAEHYWITYADGSRTCRTCCRPPVEGANGFTPCDCTDVSRESSWRAHVVYSRRMVACGSYGLAAVLKRQLKRGKALGWVE